jgi:hypothetical protein
VAAVAAVVTVLQVAMAEAAQEAPILGQVFLVPQTLVAVVVVLIKTPLVLVVRVL